jgi:hypothetical protein
LETLEPRDVPSTGTLVIEAFDDANANGTWDAGEGLQTQRRISW